MLFASVHEIMGHIRYVSNYYEPVTEGIICFPNTVPSTYLTLPGKNKRIPRVTNTVLLVH